MKSKEKLRIIFMGTPDFAVASLRALVDDGFNIIAVITATDKYGGRGGKVWIESPVKQFAREQNIPILQPTNLKNKQFHNELKALRADVQFVVAFRMLPEIVWDMPEYGTINLHGSMLPKYRGAAPINWAIIRGEKYTGVTTFKLKHDIDTGDIIFQKKLIIEKEDSAGDIHDKLMMVGAELLVKTAKALLLDTIKFQKQSSHAVTDAPKLKRETCKIDFHNTATNIYNFIRGLSPYPGAWFKLDDNEIKVFKARKELVSHSIKSGRILSDQKTYIKIACLDGFIRLEELKLSGKNQMDVRSFLNGNKIKNQQL